MNKINELFGKEMKIINIGVDSFGKELKDHDINVVRCDWKPPAGGNKKMASLLSKLKKN